MVAEPLAAPALVDAGVTTPEIESFGPQLEGGLDADQFEILVEFLAEGLDFDVRFCLFGLVAVATSAFRGCFCLLRRRDFACFRLLFGLFSLVVVIGGGRATPFTPL